MTNSIADITDADLLLVLDEALRRAQWDRSATSGIDAKADADGYVNPPERPGVDD